MNRDFARRLRLRDRTRQTRGRRQFGDLTFQLQYEKLIRSEQMVPRGFTEWSCEVRHPFAYRPLVELLFEIPWEEKVCPHVGKPLLRRALTPLLPEKVRTRQGGAGPGPAAYKAYSRRWASIEPVVRSSVLVAMGYLDGSEFERSAETAAVYRRLIGEDPRPGNTRPVMQVTHRSQEKRGQE